MYMCVYIQLCTDYQCPFAFTMFWFSQRFYPSIVLTDLVSDQQHLFKLIFLNVSFSILLPSLCANHKKCFMFYVNAHFTTFLIFILQICLGKCTF